MSTRAIVRLVSVMGDEEEVYATIYQHYDGYPEERGVDIAGYLLAGKMVNGIGSVGDEVVWNGFDDFAAAYICHFKHGPGGLYLFPTPFNGSAGQEYEYDVKHDGQQWKIVIRDHETFFEGSPQELLDKYGRNDG